MSNLPIYGFGGEGGGLVVYGFGTPIAQPDISLSSGTIRGGDQYVISNIGGTSSAFTDVFPGSSLNTGLWSDISADGGSISVNDGLTLQIPTSGGTAGITSTTTSSAFDISVSYSYDSSVERLNPVVSLVYCMIRLSIDSTNYAIVQHGWTQTTGPTITFTVVSNGVTIFTQSLSATSADRTLRVARLNGHLQAFFGGILITDYLGWTNIASTQSILSTCTSSPRQLTTTISLFNSVPLIVFGDIFASPPQITSDTLVGSTPSAVLPGDVSIIVYSYGAESLNVAIFSYFAPLQLTISEGNIVGSLVIDNDDTLRDSSATLSGLRI